MTTENSRADALTEAVTRTIDTIKRQLALIAERAPGDFLDKRPVVQSLGAHAGRLEKALAASPVEQPAAAPACKRCGATTAQACNDRGCFYLESGDGEPAASQPPAQADAREEMTYQDGLRAALNAVSDEHLQAPTEEHGDVVYDRAVGDCENAIRDLLQGANHAE